MIRSQKYLMLISALCGTVSKYVVVMRVEPLDGH